MENSQPNRITVETLVKAPIDKVWRQWSTPADIMKWNSANDDWHTPHAENDLRTGGRFMSRMEAKDGSFGFDFGGVYDEVEHQKKIAYTMGDGRQVEVLFEAEGEETIVKETFDAETQNSLELQRSGWQSILDNFKRYVESN